MKTEKITIAAFKEIELYNHYRNDFFHCLKIVKPEQDIINYFKKIKKYYYALPVCNPKTGCFNLMITKIFSTDDVSLNIMGVCIDLQVKSIQENKTNESYM